MKLVIRMGNRSYIPIRAIPIVTDHLFRARDIPALFAYPEHYADAEHDFVVTPYTINAVGQIRIADRGYFECLDKAWNVAAPEDEAGALEALPESTVVPADELRHFFNFLRRRDAGSPAQDKQYLRQWLEEADITPEMESRIARGFSQVLFRISSRRNSKVVQLAALEQLIQSIDRGARRANRPFDRTLMPGTKAQLVHEIRHRHPGLSRSPATLADHLHELGLRWRQGAREIRPYWPSEFLGP